MQLNPIKKINGAIFCTQVALHEPQKVSDEKIIHVSRNRCDGEILIIVKRRRDMIQFRAMSCVFYLCSPKMIIILVLNKT